MLLFDPVVGIRAVRTGGDTVVTVCQVHLENKLLYTGCIRRKNIISGSYIA